MKLYDVEGHEHPLRLSEEHAELIGATEHTSPMVTPTKNATKAVWVDFAVAQGADPVLAETLTRTELVERYGNAEG